ncbi:MAG: mtrB [Micrococcaceae bacterium]|nr:mtrB [Micrococcaceae bacterium]
MHNHKPALPARPPLGASGNVPAGSTNEPESPAPPAAEQAEATQAPVRAVVAPEGVPATARAHRTGSLLSAGGSLRHGAVTAAGVRAARAKAVRAKAVLAARAVGSSASAPVRPLPGKDRFQAASPLVRAGWQRLRPVRILLAKGWNALLRRWRISLQFRTVMVMVLVAFLAFAGVGAYLSQQIANGLFQERLQQAKQESSRGISQVQESFDNAQLSDLPSVSTYVRDTLTLLEDSASDQGRRYLMVQIPGQGNSLAVRSVDSGGITTATIPDALRRAVQAGSGQFWQSIPLASGTSDVHPAVAVGSQVDLLGTRYELYLLYDLSQAQETLDYIQSVLWLGGAILLLLIGGITWYVTRNVVQPVSHAAAVSEKLAAGQLEERMTVRGEDEVARLATSFNRMATSLQDQITQLATLSQMQQRFVSDVSHELRTPLTTVRMAAEVLYDARQGFDPINKRSAELLYHQVERFQALLADLLEISRFDAGAAVLDAEPQDIFQVIQHLVEGTEPLAEQYGSALLVVSLVEGNSSVVDMDPRRIDRILRNLVINALEHGDGKPVEVYVASDADCVAVAVRDYGSGMGEGDVARVFDRFWRADPARARTTGGSGLGLSIATEDARLHGGWLDAWGMPQGGSCFRLTLPRRSGSTLTHSPLPLPPDGAEGGFVHLTAPPAPTDDEVPDRVAGVGGDAGTSGITGVPGALPAGQVAP